MAQFFDMLNAKNKANYVLFYEINVIRYYIYKHKFHRKKYYILVEI